MILHPKYILKHFNEIFEHILSIYVSSENEIRQIASTLDNKLKEVINFAFQENQTPPDLDLTKFFDNIIQKLNINNHPSIKLFTVSWISFMDTIPEIRIFNVLPDFLPGLFKMLSDSQKDVMNASEKCLKEFLKEIKKNFDCLNFDIENKILIILIDICKGRSEFPILTAFEWILNFLKHYEYYFIESQPNRKSFKKSYNSIDKASIIQFKTIQPFALDMQESRMSSPKETLIKLKSGGLSYHNDIIESNELPKVPFNLFPNMLHIILSSVNHPNIIISESAKKSNAILLDIINKYTESSYMDIKLFEEIIIQNFCIKNDATQQILLYWIDILFTKFHEDMFKNLERFIEEFSKILISTNPNIFEVLDLLCKIAKYKEENIEIVISKILDKLCFDKELLNKGLEILKKLCDIISVDRVYLTIAEALMRMKSSNFICEMLHILDIFLLTKKESEYLRNLLKSMRKSKNISNNYEKDYFEKLFRTWSYNPVSTLILCLVSDHFELSYYLIMKFGEIRLDKNNYLQLARLVQMLESPIFNNIRVLLLEPIKNIFLVKTLYGILMILPQGNAYQVLSKRMKNVEMLYKIDFEMKNTSQNEFLEEEIQTYLKIFEETQNNLNQN